MNEKQIVKEKLQKAIPQLTDEVLELLLKYVELNRCTISDDIDELKNCNDFNCVVKEITTSINK